MNNLEKALNSFEVKNPQDLERAEESSLNNNLDLLANKLSKKEVIDCEELKNKEEIELSSIETKKPFASKLKKTLLIITTAVVLMSATPVFANSQQNSQYEGQKIEQSVSIKEGLELNKETGIMTYTYLVDGDIDVTDYNKNRRLETQARGAFAGELQKIFVAD